MLRSTLFHGQELATVKTIKIKTIRQYVHTIELFIRKLFLFAFHRLAVTYKAQTGGFRILSNNGVKQYYTGRQTSRNIELKFDTEGPYHCSQKGECSDSSTMMKIKNDVTKVPGGYHKSSQTFFLKSKSLRIHR